MADLTLSASDIAAAINKSLDGFQSSTEARTVGRVTEVGDGIARVSGLPDCAVNELLEFEGGIVGLALNLDEDSIGTVILGDADLIEEGQPVKSTGNILSVPVGDAMLGRVVNALGTPIDGKGDIVGSISRRVEIQAPGIMGRKPVHEPLQTGIKSIDAMTPIGRGQRELIMIDAAYRASAKRVTAVCPFYGYARQDRKAEGREPITARLIADMFKAAGSKRMVSIDLHSGQIQGFFEGPVDHLTAIPVLEKYVRSNARDGVVIVSPDAGRVKVAERFAQHLADMNADVAFINKRRPKNTANVAVAKEVIGEVEGRLCILTDDMIDTGGTIVSAAELLMNRGAKEVWAMATHGVLSGPAIERLENSPITRVVLTNTLPLPEEKRIAKIEVLSVAKILADALSAVFDETSVSDLFDGENQS